MSSATWVDSIVRCPRDDASAAAWATTTAPVLLNNNTTAPALPHLRGLYISGSAAADAFPFISTTILYAAKAVLCLVALLLVLRRYHGAALRVVAGLANGPDSSDSDAPSTSTTTAQSQHGDAATGVTGPQHSNVSDIDRLGPSASAPQTPSHTPQKAPPPSQFEPLLSGASTPMGRGHGGGNGTSAGGVTSTASREYSSDFALSFASAYQQHGNGTGTGTVGGELEPLATVRRTIYHKSVRSRWWIIYLGLCCVAALFGVLSLQIYAAIADEDTRKEVVRVLVLLERVSVGLSGWAMCVAINYERVHRTQDHKGAKASRALRRQALRLNIVTLVVYFAFVVIDFVSSHLLFMSSSSSGSTALFWVYFLALLVMAAPSFVALGWVVLHRADVGPSTTSKAVLVVAVTSHFVAAFPPTCWNDHWLHAWVVQNPCPLGALSFYDLILLLSFVPVGLLVLFIRTEHRRNKFILLRRALAKMEAAAAASTTIHSTRPQQGGGAMMSSTRSITSNHQQHLNSNKLTNPTLTGGSSGYASVQGLSSQRSAGPQIISTRSSTTVTSLQ